MPRRLLRRMYRISEVDNILSLLPLSGISEIDDGSFSDHVLGMSG